MSTTGALPRPGSRPADRPGNAAAAPRQTTAARAPTQLGLGLLVALVVGSIVRNGIFGLPQNMAAGAGAILSGWAVTGIGMRC